MDNSKVLNNDHLKLLKYILLAAAIAIALAVPISAPVMVVVLAVYGISVLRQPHRSPSDRLFARLCLAVSIVLVVIIVLVLSLFALPTPVMGSS